MLCLGCMRMLGESLVTKGNLRCHHQITCFLGWKRGINVSAVEKFTDRSSEVYEDLAQNMLHCDPKEKTELAKELFLRSSGVSGGRYNKFRRL